MDGVLAAFRLEERVHGAAVPIDDERSDLGDLVHHRGGCFSLEWPTIRIQNDIGL